MHPVTQLDQALRAAGLPIVGVSLGDAQDKTTWRVDFEEDATPEQQAAAARVIAAFTPTVVVEVPALTLEGVIAWCADKFGVDRKTAETEAAQPQKVAP